MTHTRKSIPFGLKLVRKKDDANVLFKGSFTDDEKKSIVSYLTEIQLDKKTLKIAKRSLNINALIEVLIPNGLMLTSFYVAEISQ